MGDYYGSTRMREQLSRIKTQLGVLENDIGSDMARKYQEITQADLDTDWDDVFGGHGGGDTSVAQIHVVYSAGQTITATDGTTTLTSDTSGDYTFNIPNVGTWTISNGQIGFTQIITPHMINFMFHVYFNGYGKSSISYQNEELVGTFTLLLLALNTEASTYTLENTQTVKVNDIVVSGRTLHYQTYDRASGITTRNHRFLVYDIELSGNDTVTITNESSERPPYLGYTCALVSQVDSESIQCRYVRTSDGLQIEDSYETSGYVFYGFMNNALQTGTANCEIYTAGDIIDTGTGQESYGAGYIFFLTE